LFVVLFDDRQIQSSTNMAAWTQRRAAGTAATLIPSYRKMLVWNHVTGTMGAACHTDFSTSPDGITWTARTNPASAGYEHHSLSFDPVSGDWILFSGNSNAGVAGGRALFRSSDDGVTWVDITPPSVILGALPAMEITCTATHMILGGNNTESNLGESQVAWISTDGGTTWRLHRIVGGRNSSAQAYDPQITEGRLVLTDRRTGDQLITDQGSYPIGLT
jgi:hypothetical protein